MAFSFSPDLTRPNGFDPYFEFDAGAAKSGNNKPSIKWAFLHGRKLKIRTIVGFFISGRTQNDGFLFCR
jgi:hypothetical protein